MLIATAGHIDHGKTALVRALSDIETDRLPEEKARGITIDLGFAYWRPEPDLTIGFVDVPGHERFVRNMLSGLGGIGFALIVVAADDGIMPQTIEHLQILDLLGFDRGAVAITKSDLVTPERLADVSAQVRSLLAATALADLPIYEVSARSGSGIAALSAELVAAARLERATPDDRNFRMAIDRAFTKTGTGTVVTGTVLSGELKVGDPLVVAVGGLSTRVRGLQSAGQAVETVAAGQRCAVNIAGIEVSEIHRGDWLLPPAMHRPTDRIEVRLRLLDGLETPLKHAAMVHFHHGTADIGARVLMRRRVELTSGEDTLAILALDRPTSAITGDRFVLRDPSGRHLLGGGRIVDPYAPADRRDRTGRELAAAALELSDPAAALKALLAIEDRDVDTEWFGRCFNLSPDAAGKLFSDPDVVLLGKDGELVLSAIAVDGLNRDILETVAAFHREHPEIGGITKRELRRRMPQRISAEALAALLRELASQGRIATGGALARLPDHATSFSEAEIALWHSLQGLLDDCGPKPVTVTELVRELHASEAAIRAMLYRRRLNGDLWAIEENRFMLREHVAELAALAADLAIRSQAGFTAAQFRDASGIGRNFVIKILEFFDRIGVTGRRGDRRVIRPDFESIVGQAEAAPKMPATVQP